MTRPGPRARAALRALAVITLALAIPVGVSAAFTHLLLDGTEWDDPTPAPTIPLTPPTSTATPAPADDRPGGQKTGWALGDCYTPTLTRTPCTRPGALRIVGVIHQPQADPCSGLPETTRDVRTGTYALCLKPHTT